MNSLDGVRVTTLDNGLRVATDVMPKRPPRSSPYLLISVEAWLKERMLSSCASTVSSHFIFGWHLAA